MINDFLASTTAQVAHVAPAKLGVQSAHAVLDRLDQLAFVRGVGIEYGGLELLELLPHGIVDLVSWEVNFHVTVILFDMRLETFHALLESQHDLSCVCRAR